MLERTLVVGAGGFLGSAARYLVQGLVYRYLPADFPYATFLINVTGCFVDTEEKIQGFLPRLDEMVKEGLVTVEKATVIFHRGGERPAE